VGVLQGGGVNKAWEPALGHIHVIGRGYVTDWRTEDLEEARQDAVSVLQDMLSWRLSAARWDAIAGSVEALATYLDLGDLAAARDIVIQLELAGPVRITRIGAVPSQPPPPPVRDRVNHLIYRLSGGDSRAAAANLNEGEEGAQADGTR
jgi:hypothetical protein